MTQFERLFNWMKIPWVMVIYFILVVVSFNYVDRPLAIVLHQLNLRDNLVLFQLITVLGKEIYYIVLFGLGGLCFRYGLICQAYEAKSWYLLLCMLVPYVLCLFLKITLSRARPDLLFSQDLYGFYWFQLKSVYWSMPSGHTTAITSLAAGLGVLWPRSFYWVLVPAFLIILSRVLLYHHYLSDVMVGFYLCLLIIGFLTQWIQRNALLPQAFD